MDNRLRLQVLGLPRPAKRAIVMLVDASLAVFSVWIAFYLRLGYFQPIFEERDGLFLIPAILVAVLVSMPIFIIFGLYRTIFRYSGVPAVLVITKAIAFYGIIFASVFTVVGVAGVPRTIGLLQPVVFLLFIALSRFVARFWLGGMYIEQLRQGNKPRALIYGAGDAGRELAAALSHSQVTNVIGFLDDDPKLHGSQIRGLPVYNPSDIAMITSKKRVVEVMLALPRISRRRRGEILQSLRGQNVVVRTLPSLSDLAEGRVTVSDIRELSISDILGRDTVAPDQRLMKRDIENKTVLVTGVGGSIGGELCRQIFAQNPKNWFCLTTVNMPSMRFCKNCSQRQHPKTLGLKSLLFWGLSSTSRALTSCFRPARQIRYFMPRRINMYRLLKLTCLKVLKITFLGHWCFQKWPLMQV